MVLPIDHREGISMQILPMSSDPFTPPTDRDMLASERRALFRTHRTCVFGTNRRADGPAMSIVYYVPTDRDELLVSTMRDRSKAKVVARQGKASLCVLDEQWPFSYLQVYCDASEVEDRARVSREVSDRPLHNQKKGKPHVGVARDAWAC